MSVYKPYNPTMWEDRKEVIKIIEDLRNGNSFEHFKQKFFDPNREKSRESISDENKKRLYVTKGAVDEVISKIVAFCPILEIGTYENAERNSLLKNVLKNIDWETLNTTIYDILESKGDCFLYFYFEEKSENDKDKKMYPYISIIPTEEISDIVLDKFNKPIAYIWSTKHKDTKFNFETKKVEVENERDVVIVFEKGKVTMVEDDSKKSGVIISKDSKNKVNILKTVENVEEIKNLFSIIHIKANDVANSVFSKIPADKYIDDSLRIDQIESDIRGANRLIGFPKLFLIDGQIVDGSTHIGGFASIKSDRDEVDETEDDDTPFSNGWLNTYRYPQAQVKDIQIANDLKSMFVERNDVYDSLHEKAGLTPPSLNVHLSKSDSSKVYQQINRRMEQKIQIYIQSIIKGFKPFFEAVLRINNLWTEEDIDLSFKMPTSVLRDSAYDLALTNSIKLKSGEETLQSLLRKKGYTDEEIQKQLADYKKELEMINLVDVIENKQETNN